MYNRTREDLQPTSSNDTQDLEPEVEGRWTKLDISNMKLVALSPNIGIYNNITELYLQSNCLTSLPLELFKSLIKLRVLDLSNNQIAWLQPEISNLLQLRDLNLNGNYIRELPVEMGKLFRLEKLGLKGNSIVKPPADVLEKGTRYIISYFRDRMQSGEPPPAREWATNPKPSTLQPEGVRVLCYNVLADSNASLQPITYCPRWALSWEYRKHRILKEILQYEPDIISLQEVEVEQFRNFFQGEMQSRGYSAKFQPRSRARHLDENSKKTVDGCAIFWKKDLFNCVHEEVIDYQAIALQKHDKISQVALDRIITKDNIALCLLLKPKGTLKVFPYSESDQVLVVNTHIHWNPEFTDVKLMQVALLLEKLEQMAKKWGKTPNGKVDAKALPIIMCGDFNSGTDSGVYQLLTTNKVEANHPDFAKFDYGDYSKKGFEHNLSLSSSYGVVTGEPAFTNYTDRFVGLLDFIWFSNTCLHAERVLVPHTEEVILSHNGALPNPYMCSDHIPLAVELYGKIPPGKPTPRNNQQ